jgi:CRISPR-associated protein Csb2
MPTVIINFPGGRYHATPWGHHVNEGQIEWPPCPWRLLRALIATGYSKLAWREVPPAGRRLIETLAGVLPTYQLPQASTAHSRHYMPIGELAKGIEKTTLVFDTWANVGEDELVIRWDCNLDDECAALFNSLVESLGYLGRSESWVEARVASSDLEFDEQRVAVPHIDGEYRGPEWEQIPLIAPVSAETYAAWYKEKTAAALTELPLPEGKKKPTKALQKKRESAIAPYPEDLIECLQKDTAWWKKQHNWSQPPGAQRVLYWRRTDSLVVSIPRVRQRPVARRVTTMLLALSTPSRNRSALPPRTRTLPQAELFHRAIVGRVGKGRTVHCPELTGKDANGRPLRKGHRHAHILPLDLDADGHLDHILVYAPMGLGDSAQETIRKLKRTWTKGGIGDLQLALVGRGELGSLRKLPDSLQPQVQRLLGPIGGSRFWTSHTPFVAPRHIKRNGTNTLHGQINAELESRGLPIATSVELLTLDAQATALRHFKRVRTHGGNPPPQDVGLAVRIELEATVPGPLCLGYGSHFGLGLFVEDSNELL